MTDRLPTIFGQSLDFAALSAATRPRPRIRLRRATCITIYRPSRAIAAVYPWSFMAGRFTFAARGRSEKPTYTSRARHKQVERIDQGRIFGAGIRLHGYRAKGERRIVMIAAPPCAFTWIVLSV